MSAESSSNGSAEPASPRMPLGPPASRSFPFPAEYELSALNSAWQHSRERLAAYKHALGQLQIDPRVACVAVSGSLNRMEAHSDSDVDLLIVLDDRAEQISDKHSASIYASVWNSIRNSQHECPVHPPKAGGIFSACVSWNSLLNPTKRGIVDEDLITYGQRIQLILDAQPLVHDNRFLELQLQILNWYSEYRIAEMYGESGPFHWLWQDVQRYWRSLRSRASWLYADEPRRSYEVNLKLRSSRMVIIASFLTSLWTVATSGVPWSEYHESLCGDLRRTPLERLQNAFQGDIRVMLTNYDYLWEQARRARYSDGAVSETDRKAMHDLAASLRLGLPIEGSDWIF